MRSNFLTLKIITMMILMAIFWIGLLFISHLVSERQSYQQDFIRDISSTQISPQSIIAPYVRVPYSEEKVCVDEQKKSFPCTEEHFSYFGADHTHWLANFKVTDDTYKRTIYRAVSYQADLSAKGHFAKPEITHKKYHWKRAQIILPVKDPRGLDQQPSIQIFNQNYPFQISDQGNSESGFDFMHISVDKYPEILKAIQNGFNFNLQLKLTGLSQFNLIPTSQHVTYDAKGNWADTKYDGQSLPYTKMSQTEQFSAQWKNIALGQQNLNKIANCENSECMRQLSNAYLTHNHHDSPDEETNTVEKIGLSTEFLESVNVYTQTDRAIKYGIVIILITFGCFFIFEVLKSLRIHPIQYALVAMAQGIFFVLLLSMSEYYAFTWAYLVAAIACISLMTWYLFFVMRGVKAAAVFSLILSMLYAVIYLLLQSNGKTFLIGSVISFIVLAAIMFITRHIDWYQVSTKPKSELKHDTATAHH
ncbi:cell envelope integrity protein CreD [Acinetobacter sp. Marseille-Q1623]|uniref:cell envelope integrity protein CreD n=1 Tax=Acinetobacter sp. Marseille-Q1623 TaxID=2697501 RepID=UPI00157AD1C6|nr:cell envelope integrity protein CreD [Acinetobacter sp. Marseille-Q1623]